MERLPKVCPKCKSPYWNKPRIKGAVSNLREVGQEMIMTQFERVSISAQQKAANRNMNPKDAWDEAAREIIGGADTRVKGCPREAFLGLCGEGMVKGIPKKPYTRSEKNKLYARKAVELLRNNPKFRDDTTKELWNRVLKDLGREKVHHNQQMHVVLALWKSNLIQ